MNNLCSDNVSINFAGTFLKSLSYCDVTDRCLSRHWTLLNDIFSLGLRSVKFQTAKPDCLLLRVSVIINKNQ